jgi:hypothetical protein
MPRSSSGRLLAVLSSLRLAVITMLTLGGVCAYATFYEMRHGTPAVQRDIYQTPWFAAILCALGANVASVMVSRFPWNKHHIGFLTAHVGILALLAGSLVSIYRGLDSNMALYEGETSDRVMLQEKALHLALPSTAQHASFPVSFEKRPPRPGEEQRFELPGSGLVLVAEEFQPHVSISESFQAAAGGAPALHFQLQAPMMTQDGWLVPDDPQRGHVDFGMVSFGFHGAPSAEQAPQVAALPHGPNHLSFVTTPEGALFFGASDAQGAVKTGQVKTGEPVPTGWPGLGVVVDQFLPSAVVARQVKAEPPPAKEDRRRSAVRVRLESPRGRSEPAWVMWGEQASLRAGNLFASVAYRAPEVALPFRVTLLRFSNESYPGSNMASTYESTVRVDDPEKGSFETLISMNHPLHHRGYIFFQSSFVEGRPMMSIFSVARAPGLPLVYLGTTLIGVGIVWMFYVKPYLARRQAQAALAAHRARENPRDEATKSVDAVPSGPPAQPAPGRI